MEALGPGLQSTTDQKGEITDYPVIKNPLNETVKPPTADDNRWSICLNARLNKGDSLPSAYFGYSAEKDPITYQPAPRLMKSE